MKRQIYILLAVLVLVGCQKDEQRFKDVLKGAPVFTTAFEEYVFDEKTKTYVDEDIKLLWHEGDELSIFTTTRMGRYVFDGKTGDNNGAFNLVVSGDDNQFITGNAISANYAVYPYSSSNSINNKEVLSVTLPSVQEYAANSFGKGANTMVAVTSGLDDYFLPFKNVGGYLILKLYGEDVTVKTISLVGNNGEKLSGSASIIAEYGKSPVVQMAETATESVEIDCGSEGIKLSTSQGEPTQFWFVIPPVTFEKGFTITVTDIDDGTMKKSTSLRCNIERNTVNSMSALEVKTIPTIPLNEIWYTSSDGAVVVPYRTIYFGATIVSNTYENGKGIIKFDKDVISIGKRTFYGCASLTSIAIPSSVTSIGESAFYGCESLESITIPEGVTSIESDTFYNCYKLKSITMPEGVVSIGEWVFFDCKSLESIEVPSSVTSIGGWAFCGCESLESITIPEDVTSVESNTFYNCFKLKSVTLPQDVTAIGDYAFTDCFAMQSIDLPQGVTSIGIGAFLNCTSLTSITIPAGITTIGEHTFRDCSALTSIILPEKLTAIGNYAFEDCAKLASIALPQGVTDIGDHAFFYCFGLISVTIPAKVTTIGDDAFFGCSGLENVYCQPTTPPALGPYGLGLSSSTRIIHVPATSVDAYKAATNWSGYANEIVGDLTVEVSQ